ncbi:sugar phosphate isomerase/epimerase family protein [Flavobacterium taihuense]|uniref:Sugar phosphate isomerase/epimerase n=1 Tax=Flavobacterium taihuense TaxID=2857508 RepID=A0ABS6XWR1_9FLAO|nr:TIM barrel protein [Flavobacterium taihuense]MBW4360334.1 sugar phosphate isomerase/epimerase [Flavobacterium taihuense]
MESNIYISSLAFIGQSVEDIIRVCQENNFNLEFSSGMPYREDMESIYSEAAVTRMPHNYFPAPKEPYVLNLASSNPEIRAKSVAHCKNGLSLSKKSNSPFFSAHAGFCIDPDPNELGKKIAIKENYNKDVHKQLFLDSLHEVLEFADKIGVDFLIENNVLAPFNYDGSNPLLCCEFSEIDWLFENVKNPRLGLLLDTAHLKVSCQTFQIDLFEEFEKISPFVKAFHHSDNDGTIDCNLVLKEDYWFLRYLAKFKEYVHVLEIKAKDISEIKQQIKLLKENGC